MHLTEPKPVNIDRVAGRQKSRIVFTNEFGDCDEVKFKRKAPRPAGDGMESPPSILPPDTNMLDLDIDQLSLHGMQTNIKYRPQFNSPSLTKRASSWQSLGSEVSATTDASQVSYLQSEVRSLCDASDSLQSRMTMLEEQNNRLIEEKLKLSSHLGIQTQVNTELKHLLVASMGEDLQQRFEKLTLDKAQIETQLHHVNGQLEGDMEEMERLHIQCDLWRSKFLASRVMVDELSSWKSALYFKYKESQTALQKLLEEHYQFRALTSAIHRHLIKVTESLACKDASLDWGDNSKQTTLDTQLLNHDMLLGIVEVLEPEKCASPTRKRVVDENQVENNESIFLSSAEELAQKTLLDSEVESKELRRLKQDYLAHSRTSHFLSTNYRALYNCCENCTGEIEII